MLIQPRAACRFDCSIAFFWMGETVATLCAPDGRYSLEDLEAFLRDLEECEGESAC